MKNVMRSISCLSLSVLVYNQGQAMGDEVRIEADVRRPRHYPYLGFDSIEARTPVESFPIPQELAEGSE